jgi:hypothetical protein
VCAREKGLCIPIPPLNVGCTGYPRLIHVLPSPIRRCLQPRHALAPQRRLAGELAPLLLPGGIGVEGEDQIPHLPGPGPAPALYAEERYHRQCREGPLADKERPGTPRASAPRAAGRAAARLSAERCSGPAHCRVRFVYP